MKAVSSQAIADCKDESPGFAWRLALNTLYAWDAAYFRAQVYVREKWRSFMRLLRVSWQAGRPVLFLVCLCLGAGVLFVPVDQTLGTIFLLAGSSALIAFVLLARRH